MNPLVIPASTVSTLGWTSSVTPLVSIIVWVLESFFTVTVPANIQIAMIGVLSPIAGALACHLTTDKPSKPAVEAALGAAEKTEEAVVKKAEAAAKETAEPAS